MTCIYKITSPTDKVYIGQTVNFNQRVRHYKSLICRAQPKLYNSLKKHGWDNHKAEILFELREDINPEMLTYWEQFFMDYYKGLGYNLLNIREAGPRGKMSQESKAKMSAAKLGKPGKAPSEETKRKLREVHLGRTGYWSGKKRPTMSGANHHNFKGFLYAYLDNILVGKYNGCYDAAIQLNMSAQSVCRSVNKAHPVCGGYIFVREKI